MGFDPKNFLRSSSETDIKLRLIDLHYALTNFRAQIYLLNVWKLLEFLLSKQAGF